MKYLLLTAAFLLCGFVGNAAESPVDSLLQELDEELKIEEVYVASKLDYIQNLQQELNTLDEGNFSARYEKYAQLFDAYKSFNYDSAFRYVNKLQDIAYHLEDESRINESKLKQAFIFLSSGMFKETFDTLNTIQSATLPKEKKQEYFSLMARAFYDLADFNKDEYFTSAYTARANTYVDSVLSVSAPDSYEYLYFRGLRSARMSDIEEGIADLETLISRNDLSYHQSAVVASTLSDLYLRTGKTKKAISLLARAAIFDIKSSTRETAAILNLANILYQQGDLRRAYQYTKKALEYANFYGARHRKIQVGSILPIIEEEKLQTVESQKELLLKYSVAVTILSVCIVLFIIFSLKQVKKLRLAKKEIDSANCILQETNQQLLDTNNKLVEANRIKEEYIGYYFNINSEYLDKIAKFKKAVEQSLLAKKFDHIRYIVGNINLKKEREELFVSFDKVFLKLFPGFISEFNSFFKEEDQIKLSGNQLLNTDLRIFALIRMGIHDNDKIAKILNYSVNTIYTYKTRVKNKAIIPNDEFEQRMMDIKPI
ncbi:DUF6377 domain-containing protein [Nafulsella turpanensis]|uniref:DUF6377 domain-containing protein n=1 Tax=Nafulsella turpanensis TaxID=1265690 RepID=UPI00034B34A6|nr:DUF6377 domain-containing protein [Nafulsella turpanensis]